MALSLPRRCLALCLLAALPGTALASPGPATLDMVGQPLGWLALFFFVVAYAFVVLEERTHLRKSKPVMLAAALIWAIIAWHGVGDLTRDPEFAAGQLALGNLLYLSGKADPRRFAERFTEARPPLEKYTQLNPTDAKGWSLLGRDYTNFWTLLPNKAKSAVGFPLILTRLIHIDRNSGRNRLFDQRIHHTRDEIADHDCIRFLRNRRLHCSSG